MSRNRDPLSRLKRVFNDGTTLLERLSHAGEKTADRTSEALFGALGGAVGIGSAWALSLTVHGALFVIGGPLGAAIGIPAAVLIFRGPGSFKEERERKRSQARLDQIKQIIVTLPEDTPDRIVDKLWDSYGAEVDAISVDRGVSTPPVSTPPVALPPPAEQPLALTGPNLRTPQPVANTASDAKDDAQAPGPSTTLDPTSIV